MLKVNGELVFFKNQIKDKEDSYYYTAYLSTKIDDNKYENYAFKLKFTNLLKEKLHLDDLLCDVKHYINITNGMLTIESWVDSTGSYRKALAIVVFEGTVDGKVPECE